MEESLSIVDILSFDTRYCANSVGCYYYWTFAQIAFGTNRQNSQKQHSENSEHTHTHTIHTLFSKNCS